MYKLCPLNLSGKQDMVVRLSDGSFVPFDPANTDCQAFLTWLKAGNFPQNPDGTTATQEQVTALITQLGG